MLAVPMVRSGATTIETMSGRIVSTARLNPRRYDKRRTEQTRSGATHQFEGNTQSGEAACIRSYRYCGTGIPLDGQCAKCLSVHAVKQNQFLETFTTGETPVGHSFVFSKDHARSISEHCVGQPYVIPAGLLNRLVYQNEYIEEHIEHIPATADKCGTIVFINMATPEKLQKEGKQPECMMSYLIDGTHRAAKALRTGQKYQAYVLNLEESWKACLSIDGRRNPFFVGSPYEIFRPFEQVADAANRAAVAKEMESREEL